jgi:hypothetical protein
MADWDETTRGTRDLLHATTGRFDSSKPNQANTPKALRHIKRTEDYNGNVDGCIADCPACKDEFGSDACVRPSHRLKPKWILHGNYAHAFDAPCALCNPPNELLRYRVLLEACYCPKPTASGYKPLCMNCQEAATLVTKILERMNIK